MIAGSAPVEVETVEKTILIARVLSHHRPLLLLLRTTVVPKTAIQTGDYRYYCPDDRDIQEGLDMTLPRPMRDFGLEVFFSRWEFTARHHMTASDVESLRVSDVIAMASATPAYPPFGQSDASQSACWKVTMALGTSRLSKTCSPFREE